MQGTFQCNIGHSLTGRPNDTLLFSVCITSGAWEPDPAAFSCRPVECGIPTTALVPNTQSVTYNGTFFNSTVQFDCTDQYHYVGVNGRLSGYITGLISMFAFRGFYSSQDCDTFYKPSKF